MEFDVLDTYFQSIVYPFTKHHIDSFHTMLKTHIPNTIQSYNPIVMLKEDPDTKKTIIRVEVFIGENGGLYVDRPTYIDKDGNTVLMLPAEARLRNLTYATKLYGDVTVKYYTDPSNLSDEYTNKPADELTPFATKKFERVILGHIPLMLHSDQCALHNQGSKVLQGFGECSMDPGGYFIIDGKEKVIVSQERIITNRLFVSKLENDLRFSYRGYIHCTGASGETALSPRSVEFVLYKHRRPEDYLEGKKKSKKEKEKEKREDKSGEIYVSLPSIKGRLPLTTVFRLFGILSDKNIVESICGPIEDTNEYTTYMNFLRPSISTIGPMDSLGDIHPIWTTEEAMDYIKDRTYFKSISHLKTIIATDIFPNIEGGLTDKGKYLGYLVGTFMRMVLGILPMSDRDSFIYKRIDVSGTLLSQLFQETYVKFRNGIRDRIDARYNWQFRQKDVSTMSDIIDATSLKQIIHGLPSDLNYDVITKTMQKSLKGMWGPPVSDPELGKVQDLARISYIGTLSHLRRVNNDLDRSIKITAPHRLHSQQWGIMCPFESPDGASIGYLKNFALLAQITFDTHPKHIIAAIQSIDVRKGNIIKPIAELSAPFLARKDVIKIFVNGSLYGVTIDPAFLVRAFRIYRRNGLFDPFVSIAWNIKENEIRINTDAGRPCRPVFIVSKGKVLADAITSFESVKWDDLIYGKISVITRDRDTFIDPGQIEKFSSATHFESILDDLEKTQGCIEYLDIEEENTMLIAMKRDDLNTSQFYTHLEIHPSTALSVVTNIVPFANHNQAPRVYFHGAQSKQAVGIYATNWHKRFDTSAYIQHYPQQRIVTTRGSHYNGNSMMPNGCNVIVAIMTHTGFNQEDSIMINRRAIDRGLFKMTAYKSMTASEKVLSTTERVFFANPETLQKGGKEIHDMKKANYSLISEDGIIKENSYVSRDQKAAVIGMIHMTQEERKVRNGVFTDRVLQPVYKDISMMTDVNHYGVVDRVFVEKTVPTNPERICKVRFRKVRRPEPGNKFCSAHGQKGVIGMILEQENMPFTKDGIVPDLIINPHALPSRMTMGHLIETVFAKLCCMKGCYGDGTVFIPFDKDKVFDELEKHNYEKYGNEILYDGRTGRQIDTDIFIGPIYYYQLKHMVVDKIQARGSHIKGGKFGNDVKRIQLTHQPTSGRSAGGGLRIGEMERDVLIGHGVSAFIRESMMEKSDKYTWAICNHCGTMADRMLGCNNCEHDDISVIETPWSFKLLTQELEGMGVQMRLSTQPVIEDYKTSEKQEESDEEDHASDKSSIPAEESDNEQEGGHEEEDEDDKDEDEEDEEDGEDGEEEDDEDGEEDQAEAEKVDDENDAAEGDPSFGEDTEKEKAGGGGAVPQQQPGPVASPAPTAPPPPATTSVLPPQTQQMVVPMQMAQVPVNMQLQPQPQPQLQPVQGLMTGGYQQVVNVSAYPQAPSQYPAQVQAAGSAVQQYAPVAVAPVPIVAPVPARTAPSVQKIPVTNGGAENTTKTIEIKDNSSSYRASSGRSSEYDDADDDDFFTGE
jgi:DNA-directed RNA polymerase II subunit RPB2